MLEGNVMIIETMQQHGDVNPQKLMNFEGKIFMQQANIIIMALSLISLLSNILSSSLHTLLFWVLI